MALESVCKRVIAFGMPLLGKVSQWRRWAIHPVFLGSLVACVGIAIYLKVQSNWKKAQEAKLQLEEETNKYQKARDTLIVWQTIALEINQTTIASELKKALKTEELVLAKAKQFGRWLQENNSVRQIRAIRFESESMTSLPDEIEKLTNLEQLYLDDNRFTTLPTVVSKLTKLVLLSLSKNQLTCLPDSIGDLQNLTNLTLDYNQIELLPDSFRKLRQLRWFSVSYNQLAIVPDWIQELTQLERLFLTGNRLSELPKMNQLPNLQRIDIQDNSFTTPPDLSAFGNIHVVA